MQKEFRFSHQLKVRYSEIDGQKIVFNAHYLTYLDIAVAEYFEEGLEIDLNKLSEEGSFDFVLAKSTIEYKNSARLGDWLTIWGKIARLGTSSFTMEFLITRKEDNLPIVTAEIIYVSYNPELRVSQPIPEFIREKVKAYESEKSHLG